MRKEAKITNINGDGTPYVLTKNGDTINVKNGGHILKITNIKNLEQIVNLIKTKKKDNKEKEGFIRVDDYRTEIKRMWRYYDGSPFKATISGMEAAGHICVTGSNIYYCTNNSNFDGSSGPRKHRYTYSWVEDSVVSNAQIRAKKPSEVKYDFKAEEILSKEFDYDVFISEDVTSIGCNVFKNEEIIKAYKILCGKDELEEMKEKFTREIDMLIVETNALLIKQAELRKRVNEITTMEVSTKTTPIPKIPGKPARDSHGRFIKIYG